MTTAFRKGDRVLIECAGKTVPGHIILASENQQSLMLGFDDVLDGHLGMMPVLYDGILYRSLITHNPVKVSPMVA